MKPTKGKGATKKGTKEALKPVEDKKLGKRKAADKSGKSSKKLTKKEKAAKKDPNKPKRPPSAFFVFLDEFRKTFKREHPNVKAVSAVGKAGGEKWKSMSDSEKAPYEAKAAKRKSEYEKLMSAYNKKQAAGSMADEEDDEEDSERSKSEVHDDEEESEEKNAALNRFMLENRFGGALSFHNLRSLDPWIATENEHISYVCCDSPELD